MSHYFGTLCFILRDSNLLGLGNRYDVYDGQQRLVTLNLLLAGLRDSFQHEANELMSTGNNNGGGKRSVALAATAHEISGMLMPTKVRKEDVLRIKLRKRDNVLLEKILIGDDEDDNDENDDGESQSSSLPTQSLYYPKMSAKEKAQLLSPLSPANVRIFGNFIHLSDRLALLTTRERLRLLDYIVERVYLLVCIPETSRIARNIVMSQGRKGMDNEPVDDFKGLVCFRYTLEEGDMYAAFDRWDALAVEPSSSSSSSSSVSSASMNGSGDASDNSDSSSIKSVGRDIISSTCNLRASAALRTKIRSRGGDEVYEWERWLRQELWLQNQRLSQEEEGAQKKQSPSDPASAPLLQPWQGQDFFGEEIEPASIALYKFRTGQWDEFAFLSKSKNGKMTKKQRETTVARLNFLRDITAGIASAKEAEIVVLELLLRAEDDDGGGGGSGMLSRYLDEILPLIEKWTLWMALTRPSPMQRHARVFSLLDAMDDFDSVGSLGLLESEMIQALKDSMDTYEFGASAGGKRLATAILKRMSAHLLVEERKNVPKDGNDSTTVELIHQQHWTSEEEREEWSNRIGNLALVSSTPPRNSRTRKGSSDSSSWESKRKRYKKEPWLMSRQLAELDQWDIDAVQDQQKDILSLMDLVWSLESNV